MIETKVLALAVFADLIEVPKILVAQHLTGLNNGKYTLIGGKNEGKSWLQTVYEEVFEETGVRIPEDIPPRRLGQPVLFMDSGRFIRLSLFYTDLGTSVPDAYLIQRKEPHHLGLWKFRSLCWLHEATNNGLFPEPVFRKVVRAAKKLTGEPWVGYMTAAAYDFPHRGLCQLTKLRRSVSD